MSSPSRDTCCIRGWKQRATATASKISLRWGARSVQSLTLRQRCFPGARLFVCGPCSTSRRGAAAACWSCGKPATGQFLRTAGARPAPTAASARSSRPSTRGGAGCFGYFGYFGYFGTGWRPRGDRHPRPAPRCARRRRSPAAADGREEHTEAAGVPARRRTVDRPDLRSPRRPGPGRVEGRGTPPAALVVQAPPAAAQRPTTGVARHKARHGAVAVTVAAPIARCIATEQPFVLSRAWRVTWRGLLLKSTACCRVRDQPPQAAPRCGDPIRQARLPFRGDCSGRRDPAVAVNTGPWLGRAMLTADPAARAWGELRWPPGTTAPTARPAITSTIRPKTPCHPPRARRQRRDQH